MEIILRPKTIKNKSIIILIFIISSLLFAPISCSLKSAVQKCKFTVDRIAIKDFSNEGFKAVVTFKIKNPTWVGLTIDDLEYTVWVNGKELGTGKSEDRISIQRRSKMYVDVPLQIKLTELSGSLFKILFSGNIEYRVKGKAVFATFLGNSEYPFDLKKELKRSKKKQKEKSDYTD